MVKGKDVKKLLQQRGWSAEDAAETIGCSPSTVYRWLSRPDEEIRGAAARVLAEKIKNEGPAIVTIQAGASPVVTASSSETWVVPLESMSTVRAFMENVIVGAKKKA